MTGRKGRVVRRPDGSVRYESRAEQGLTIDHINLKEKDRFMGGEKVWHQLNIAWKISLRLKRMCKPTSNMNICFLVGGHYIGGSQFWDLPAGRQTGEEPETQGPHDLRAAVERRQGHSAVWWVEDTWCFVFFFSLTIQETPDWKFWVVL